MGVFEVTQYQYWKIMGTWPSNFSREECKNCWAKLYCSGGCAANAFHASGSIRGIYEPGCELFRKRMECAIMIKVAEDESGK